MRRRDESRLYVLDKEGSGHGMEAGARRKGPSFAPWVKKMHEEGGVGWGGWRGGKAFSVKEG